MTVKKCDKCGSTERVCSMLKTDIITRVLGDNDDGTPYDEVRPVTHKYDLCDKCARKLQNWIVGWENPADPLPKWMEE